MKKILVSLLSLLSLSSTLIAAPVPGFYIAGGGAYVSFDNERDMDSTFAPLGGVGYTINDKYGVEATFAWLSTERDDVDRDVFGYAALFQILRYWNIPTCIQKWGKADWNRYQIVTFSGLGYTRLSPNGDLDLYNPRGNQALEQLNFNGGFGVTYALMPQIDLRAEVRNTYTLANDNSDWYSGLSLIYHFPAKASAKA